MFSTMETLSFSYLLYQFVMEINVDTSLRTGVKLLIDKINFIFINVFYNQNDVQLE
jgi:hypothetical protein